MSILSRPNVRSHPYPDNSVHPRTKKTQETVIIKQKKKKLTGIALEKLSTNVNPLTHNDRYSGRTAPLTSKRCILNIYSTNIGTEYFKHGI